MTTIALKDNHMASDGQVTLGNRIDSYNQRKVFEVEGCLVGFAGRFSSALRFLDWFGERMRSISVQNMHPEVIVSIPDNLVDEDFQAIVVYPDGDTYLFEGGDRAFKINQPYSIGSGSDFAIAAMKAGNTAEEAINIAKDLDTHSGGETFVVQLPEEEEDYTREDLEAMSKEELLELLFPEECDECSCCEDSDCEEDESGEETEEEAIESSKLAEAIKKTLVEKGEGEHSDLELIGVKYNETAGVYTKGMVELDVDDECFKFTGTSKWFKLNDQTEKLLVSNLTLKELRGVCDSLEIQYSSKTTKQVLAECIVEDIEDIIACVTDLV